MNWKKDYIFLDNANRGDIVNFFACKFIYL